MWSSVAVWPVKLLKNGSAEYEDIKSTSQRARPLYVCLTSLAEKLHNRKSVEYKAKKRIMLKPKKKTEIIETKKININIPFNPSL